jgi:hypothetical protein
MSSKIEVEAKGREDRDAHRSGRRPPNVRLGAVVALAAAAGFAAFLILRDDDSSEPSQSSQPSQPNTAVSIRAPRVVSLATLRNRAARADQPIYWAGGLRGRRYELTEAPDGSRIYLRYLPRGVPVGSRKPYLTIATYRLPNAFAATQAASKREGSTEIPVGDGGVAFFSSRYQRSVYLAYPRSDYQIEVYHPLGYISRELVSSGRIRPIRANR